MTYYVFDRLICLLERKETKEREEKLKQLQQLKDQREKRVSQSLKHSISLHDLLGFSIRIFTFFFTSRKSLSAASHRLTRHRRRHQ